jgi:hypothetical protein
MGEEVAFRHQHGLMVEMTRIKVEALFDSQLTSALG